ncbi:MAG: hypothetical protein AB4042_18010 [Leptolyngbyaceae cyanobacterium]
MSQSTTEAAIGGGGLTLKRSPSLINRPEQPQRLPPQRYSA